MQNELKKYINARRPIIWVNNNDFKEINDVIDDAIKDIDNKIVYEFNSVGCMEYKTNNKIENIPNLNFFLELLSKEGDYKNLFLIIRNVDEELFVSENIGKIAKIAEKVYLNRSYNVTVIIISEKEKINRELEKYTVILDIPNMVEEEIKKYVLSFSKDLKINLSDKDLEEFSLALKGLTKLEIDNILNMVISNENNLIFSDEVRNLIVKEKGQIIKKSSILEIINFKEGIEDIGGLNGLKEWLNTKSKIFKNIDEAKKFGVDTPKGVLLVGMPGCGKSLSAKACAKLFNVPLLRLDIGRLLGKYVGDSEHNMRIALKTAESISPCILWIDEIEKAFSGIDQNGGASDVTKRLFGQFLTWLQEKENTVFVVATANDISSFPPEFLRKGRFDEIFFVDLPSEEERKKIFEIHLKKRGKLNSNIELSKISSQTKGYCGSDIEEVVKHAIEVKYVNFLGGELTTDDLIKSINSIDSLESILSKKIDDMRNNYKENKIKSASISIEINGEKGTTGLENMIVVTGGKYRPSFRNIEIKVSNLEVLQIPVTNTLWNSIVKNNEKIDSEKPVTNISFKEILKFCNQLSQRYGLKEVYHFEDDKIYIKQLNGEIVEATQADFSKTEGFRLPTEVEWEWFAKGGEIGRNTGSFAFKYSGSDDLDEVGVNEEKELKEVRSKKNNDLGIYDCSGNVREYCFDKYVSELKTTKDYYYDNDTNKRYVIRGGSFKTDKELCRVDCRDFSSKPCDDLGFRIVRTC